MKAVIEKQKAKHKNGIKGEIEKKGAAINKSRAYQTSAQEAREPDQALNSVIGPLLCSVIKTKMLFALIEVS